VTTVEKRGLALATTNLLLLASLLALAGCSNKNQGDPNQPPLTPEGEKAVPNATAGAGGGEHAAAQAAFAANCSKCHAINGTGGSMGPDLSKAGIEASHTPAWIIAYIKNPKATKADSRMPAFEGKLSDSDLLALGNYLSSLK
jgi:mono/diheme cytochrome c family protein